MENNRDPERCELCRKPLIIKNKKKRSCKRRAIDPITNKVLIVCNACGLRLNRAEWKNKLEQGNVLPPKILLDKNVCLKNFQLFSKSVCDILGDNNANKLYCSVITPKICNCIQRHLINEENEFSVESLKELQDRISLSAFNINKDRAVELYELYVKAQQLIKMKVQKPENRKLSLNEVRGIFHLRTEEYEKFVLANREKLKKNYKLCERAVQRVLCYSNNYLHKQLKTSPNGEARIAGKSAVVSKLLPDIDTLPYKKCCKSHCTNLALTHSRLVERWRNKALLGQRNARAVIAEMLTPAGGSVNCSLFLHLVTGCSLGLLRKVQKDLKQSDGIREPPEHGLREYWRRKKINAARRQDNNRHTITGTDKSETNSNVVNTSQMKIVEPSAQVNKSVIFKTTDFIRSNIINSSNIVNSSNDQNVNNQDSITQNQDNFILSSLELTNNENNDQFQLVEPVLTNTISHTSTSIPSVITSTNNNHVPSISSSIVNVDSNVEDDTEANVQFIHITKLPSNQTGVPVLKEDEITPLKSVIILPPNCFILNDTIIVSR